MIRRLPADRHVLPNYFHKADLAQERNGTRDPAELGRGALRLAQYRSLIRQQSADLARTWFVRSVRLHRLMSQILDSKPRSNFGFQVSQSFATRADLFLRNTGPDVNLNIADYADK